MHVEVGGRCMGQVDRAVVYGNPVYKLKLDIASPNSNFYSVTYHVHNWSEYINDQLGIYYISICGSLEIALYTHIADKDTLKIFVTFVEES